MKIYADGEAHSSALRRYRAHCTFNVYNVIRNRCMYSVRIEMAKEKAIACAFMAYRK